MSDNKRRLSFKTKLAGGVILAVLLLGGGFGIWSGTGTGGAALINGVSAEPSPSASPAFSSVSSYTIIVSGRIITFQGDSYSLGNLKEKLLREYTGTERYTLLDDRAIKAVYDSVKILLNELDIEYTEK